MRCRISPQVVVAVLLTNPFALQVGGAQSQSEQSPRVPPAKKAGALVPQPPASSNDPFADFVKGPWTLPTKGFSLALPEGWRAQKGGLHHRVLSCILPGKSGEPRQIILVQMAMSTAATLQGHANSLAEPSQVQQLGGVRQLDNKPALVLKLSGIQPGMPKAWAQQRAIVTRQGKQTFTLGMFGDAGENLDATIASVFKNWKWQPLADPTRYLQLSPTSSSFLEGSLKINLPQVMQPASFEPDMTMFGITDGRTGALALTMTVSPLTSPSPVEFSLMRRNFAVTLKQGFGLERELVWKVFEGEPQRALTNFLKAPDAMAEPGYPSSVAFGVVKMPRNQWALITFVITGQNANAQSLYSATASKIFASVKRSAVAFKR